MSSMHERILADVAREKLNIPTMETRVNDHLDFYELPVWAIRDALRTAFYEGMKFSAAVLVATATSLQEEGE